MLVDVFNFDMKSIHFIDSFDDFILLWHYLFFQELKVTKRMIVCTEQIDVEIKRFCKIFTKMGVDANGYFLSNFGDYDERSIEQSDYIFIFFLVTILFHFLPHDVIEGADLISQIIKEIQ